MVPVAIRRADPSTRGARVGRLRDGLAARTRASPGTLRGALWTLLVAVDFFLLSNPLVFISSFDESLRDAVVLTAAAALVTVLWLRLPAVPWALLAFLGFAALSSAWSTSSGATWHAVGLYALVAAVGVLVAANGTVAVVVDGLTLGGALIVAGSYYALREGLPGAAVPPSTDGFMAGVGTNRNILAYTLVLALAAAVSVAPRSLVGWVVRVAFVAVIVRNIDLAASSTGYLAAAAVVAVAVGIALFDAVRVGWARAVVVAVFLAGAVFALTQLRRVVGLLGEDAATLSGRVPLWHAVVDVMQQGRLLTGYGWGAVWGHPWSIPPANEVLSRIHAQAGFPAAHGHSSLLDVLPELGLVGVGLGAAVYLWVAFEAVRLRWPSTRRTVDLAASRFLLVGLVGHLALGLTEPLFTIPVGFFVLALMVGSGRPQT